MRNAAAQAHHQIKTSQILLSRSKYPPQQTLCSVALDCQPFDLVSNDQSQSGIFEIVGFSKNLKKLAAGRTSESDNRGEFFCLMQPVAFREIIQFLESIFELFNLHRQSGSSLGTTSSDNCRPTVGFHANPKAMGSFSPSYGRLVSAFHFSPWG